MAPWGGLNGFAMVRNRATVPVASIAEKADEIAVLNIRSIGGAGDAPARIEYMASSMAINEPQTKLDTKIRGVVSSMIGEMIRLNTHTETIVTVINTPG